MFQDFNLIGSLTSAENVFLPLELEGVGLTGALLGALLGFGPGIAFAMSLTTDSTAMDGVLIPADPTVVVPWLGLALVVLGVPLLTALVAGLSVRRTPLMTRRGD